MKRLHSFLAREMAGSQLVGLDCRVVPTEDLVSLTFFTNFVREDNPSQRKDPLKKIDLYSG